MKKYFTDLDLIVFVCFYFQILHFNAFHLKKLKLILYDFWSGTQCNLKEKFSGEQ